MSLWVVLLSWLGLFMHRSSDGGSSWDGWSRLTLARMTQPFPCVPSTPQQASPGVFSWRWQDRRREWKCVSISSGLCSNHICLPLMCKAPPSIREGGATGRQGLSEAHEPLLVTRLSRSIVLNKNCSSLRGILVPAVNTIIFFTLLHLVFALQLIKQQNSPGHNIL